MAVSRGIRGRSLALAGLCLLLSPAARAAVVRVPRVELTPAQMSGLGVRTAPLRPAAGRPVASLPATFQPPPNGRAAVSAPFAGVIQQVSVMEGQPVRRGQTLATLFSRDALNASAEAAQASADATLAAQAQRRTALLVREGIVAGARGEEADARLKSAQAMLAAKSIAVRSAGADLHGRYTLRAPFAGRVAHVGVQAGQGLEAMGLAFLIDRTDRIQAYADMPAALAGKVRVGDPARVEGASGTVVSVGSEIDPKTRSIPLLVEAPPRPDFTPGRLTRLEVLDGRGGGQLIDRGALIRVQDQDVVFARKGNGFALTPVQVLGFRDGQAELKTGLADGTQVAVSGVSQMKSALEK